MDALRNRHQLEGTACQLFTLMPTLSRPTQVFLFYSTKMSPILHVELAIAPSTLRVQFSTDAIVLLVLFSTEPALLLTATYQFTYVPSLSHSLCSLLSSIAKRTKSPSRSLFLFVNLADYNLQRRHTFFHLSQSSSFSGKPKRSKLLTC